MSFKTLHSFTITLDRTVTETAVREENGQKITVETKVVKPVEHVVLLKEPSRREKNELALFKDVTYGDAISKGLVTKLKMQQLLGRNDPTNPLSEAEDKNLTALNRRLTDLSNSYMQLNGKEVTPSKEVEDRKAEILLEWGVLQQKALDLNGAYQSVYAHTAESYTQTKMLMWLTLYLTYIKEAGATEPRALFPGADYAAKENVMADLEDTSDPLFAKVTADGKLSTYWMLFLFGRAGSPEDYKAIEEDWAKEKAMKEEAEAKLKAAEEAAAAEAKAKVAADAPAEVAS